MSATQNISPTETAAADHFGHPKTLQAFKTIKGLIWAYLGIGILALTATWFMRDDLAEVNDAVWGRNIGVVVSAALMLLFAARASRGVRWAYRRLRIMSILVPIAIAVIISLPGAYPLWMKIEQGFCGLLLIGIAIVINSSHVRSLFRKQTAIS